MTISKVQTLIDSSVSMFNCTISRKKKDRIISEMILSPFFLDHYCFIDTIFQKNNFANSSCLRNTALKTSMKTHQMKKLCLVLIVQTMCI